MSTLATLLLACSFLSGVAAGAWLNGFVQGSRRPTIARR